MTGIVDLSQKAAKSKSCYISGLEFSPFVRVRQRIPTRDGNPLLLAGKVNNKHITRETSTNPIWVSRKAL